MKKQVSTNRLETPAANTKEQVMSEVIKKETVAGSLAEFSEFQSLMDSAPVDKKDFLIPKLLLMQSTSGNVKEEKARVGEIRSSTSGKKITEKEGTVEIIGFAPFKTWVVLKKQGGEFLEQFPITPENASLPREQVKDGIVVNNYETINYYCLLTEEIKSGLCSPYMVSFRSTSYIAGKAMETKRAMLKSAGIPIPFMTFNLGSASKKNDSGSFYVLTISEGRKSTEEELRAVKPWNDLVKVGDVAVDHDSEFASPKTGVTAEGIAFEEVQYEGHDY
jgi:hypothetical protein